MAIKETKLKTYPQNLPDDMDVRDYNLGGGKYARVIMEASRDTYNGVTNFVLFGQAYELDKQGRMVQAPNGYPSRTSRTPHTVPESAMGLTIELEDAWVMFAGDFDPENPGDVATVDTKPEEPGDKYGETVWCEEDQCLYRWTEGFADIVARVKLNDLLTVLKTSDLRSGFAFRNRRNQE